jgi:putative colanic acid biosysnthesis UDP-glucose lipid carrier transferase
LPAGLLREHEEVLHSLQRVVDVAWIAAAHYLAIAAYHQSWRPESSTATLIAALAFTAGAELCGLYRPWRIERFPVEVRTVLLTWLLTACCLVMAAFATKTSGLFSRLVSFGWFALAPLFLCAWRLLLRSVLRSLRASGRNSRSVAILGATEGAQALCEQFRERPWYGMRIMGVFDDRGPERRLDLSMMGGEFLGGTRALVEACRDNLVDAVYIALPLRAEPRIVDILRQLSNTTATVYLLADFFVYDLLCARWSAVGNIPLLSVHDTPFTGLNALLKRLEDIIVGSLIVVLISVPLAIIALAVKLTSRGPVFFRQRRHGLNGREIRILKFRTMTVCEDGPVIQQARRDDQRVTRLGRFLRRTSLDELPQFLQVLTGEMSIVGPRPHAVAHNEQYRAMINRYMLRHKVKPGITGWAQVNGWRGETPDVSWMENRVRFDLDYIQRWTVLWDLKIILLTIFGRKKNRNAY